MLPSLTLLSTLSMIVQNSSTTPIHQNNTIVGVANDGNLAKVETAQTNLLPPNCVFMNNSCVNFASLPAEMSPDLSAQNTVPKQLKYIPARDLPVQIFRDQPDRDPAAHYVFTESSYALPVDMFQELDATDPGVGAPTVATGVSPVSSGTMASVEAPSEYSSSTNASIYCPPTNQTINSQLFNRSAMASSSSSSDFNISLSAYIPPLNPSMVS